jgi:hypothetical protein
LVVSVLLLGLDGLELGVLGAVLEPDEDDLSLEELEPDMPDGELLEPDEDAEPDGEDGEVDDAPREDELLAPRSQPYRPPTATARGIRTNADFLIKLIWTLLSMGGLGCPLPSAVTVPAKWTL